MQDLWRRKQTYEVLGISDAEEDVVNLLYRRDFLLEAATYDVVVLHSIFHHRDPRVLTATVQMASPDPANALVPISLLHTPSLKSWRSRLRSTRAQHIVVMVNAPSSLGANNLGEIQGYTVRQIDKTCAVYDLTYG